MKGMVKFLIFCRAKLMRWIVLAVGLVVSAANVYSSEQTGDEATSFVDMSDVATGVTVSAIPMPSPVLEILKPSAPATAARSTKRIRLAKKKPAPIMMLSRTERRQMALLFAGQNTPGQPVSFFFDPEENTNTGLDELDLHRSFSRPRVAKDLADDAEDADALPEEIKLRLMFARLRAVDAHALNQVPDTEEPLPESVLRRLQLARMQAVSAHQKRFS